MYKHQIYNLNIISNKQLNLPIAEFNTPNLTILFTQVNAIITNPVYVSDIQQIAAESYLLEIKNVAKYWVVNPQLIHIEAYTDNMLNIEAYLFGTIFAFILQLHGYLVIHGAALLHNEMAYIISGQSGMGKSTTSFHLYNQGYPLISDDMLVIKLINNQAYIMPSHSRIKLCHDVLLKNKHNLTDYRLISTDTQKYEYPIDKLVTKPVIARVFIELGKTEGNEVIINPIKDMIAKANKLIINSFRLYLLKHQGLFKERFKDYVMLANNLTLYELKRPENHDSIAQVISQITSIIDKDLVK